MSRTDAGSAALRRRPARTVPAVLVAFVLLGIGVGMAWVAVLRLSAGSWLAFVRQIGSWTTQQTWGSTTLIAISIAVAVVGLLVLIAALTPGKPTALRISEQLLGHAQVHTEIVMTRRSVAKLATARAEEVDGVDSISTRVRAGSVMVSVKTPSAQRAEIEQAVTHRVRAALQAAGLDPMPKVAVSARTQSL